MTDMFPRVPADNLSPVVQSSCLCQIMFFHQLLHNLSHITSSYFLFPENEAGARTSSTCYRNNESKAALKCFRFARQRYSWQRQEVVLKRFRLNWMLNTQHASGYEATTMSQWNDFSWHYGMKANWQCRHTHKLGKGITQSYLALRKRVQIKSKHCRKFVHLITFISHIALLYYTRIFSLDMTTSFQNHVVCVVI